MEKLNLNAQRLDAIRSASPLIHHLTNQVTINDCANITLALGASPAMTDMLEDALELVSFAGALVINMGTITPESVTAMIQVGQKARDRGIPVVFDPVAAGATAPRRRTALEILHQVRPTVIKGNGAEIKFLAGLESLQRGVDSLETDGIPQAALALARKTGAVVVATGITDYVTKGEEVWSVSGGHPYMGRITGTGCMSASVQAGWAAAGGDPLDAALLGVLSMNIAGERAHKALLPGEGTGHYRTRLIDAVSLLTPEDLRPEGRIHLAPL